MKFAPVTSSFIDSVGYDAATGSMTVKFANGSTQTHPGVTPDKHRELVNSDSVGGYYNKNFRSSSSKPAVIKKNPIK